MLCCVLPIIQLVVLDGANDISLVKQEILIWGRTFQAYVAQCDPYHQAPVLLAYAVNCHEQRLCSCYVALQHTWFLNASPLCYDC